MKKFDNFISQFTDYVRRIQMQPRIRDVVREQLSAYADLHALTEGTVLTATRSRFLERINVNIFRVGFAILIVAVGTGGVAYASHDALPGDTLYPVKVGVVERLESAMLYDAKTRATWNAILAERRLSEAAALAVRGELDEETRLKLEERFEYHAARSAIAADEVRAKGNVAVALAVHSDLEARLAAHADLFSYLATEEGEAKKMLGTIARVRDTASAARQKTEAEIPGHLLAYDADDIDATASVTEEVARIAQGAGDTATGGIDARITAARAALSSARDSMARDESGVAYVATQVAARLTHEASILSKNRSLIALGKPSAPSPTPADTAAPAPAAASVSPVNSATMMMKVPDVSITATTSTEATTTPEEESEEDEDNAAQEETSSRDQPSSSESNESTSSETSKVESTVKKIINVLPGI